MLYLEDYLEMIEHLPQELRDRFTEIRELDLQVQNADDKLENRVRGFFSEAKRMKGNERGAVYEDILKEYYNALEDADEKVQLGNQMYDLVDRYLRRLDQELHKFKLELEADNAGITEVLEQRSLELDNPSGSYNHIHLKENRMSLSSFKTEKRNLFSERKSIDKVLSESRMNQNSSSLGVSVSNLTPISAGSNALAAAASQAIAATQQRKKPKGKYKSRKLVVSFPFLSHVPKHPKLSLPINKLSPLPHHPLITAMQQGRRTASLKASYEAVSQSLGAPDLGVVKDTGTAVRPTTPTNFSEPVRRQKRKMSLPPEPSPPSSMDLGFDESIMDLNGDNPDWVYDPNEPRYCICNQVSYGDMVACDNTDCPFEWFHYPCVGITAPPKGKWFCPQCTASMKRKSRK